MICVSITILRRTCMYVCMCIASTHAISARARVSHVGMLLVLIATALGEPLLFLASPLSNSARLLENRAFRAHLPVLGFSSGSRPLAAHAAPATGFLGAAAASNYRFAFVDCRNFVLWLSGILLVTAGLLTNRCAPVFWSATRISRAADGRG